MPISLIRRTTPSPFTALIRCTRPTVRPKKANDLDKQGTLKYSFKNDSKDQPVIYMKGKLSDIPMDQTVSVKDKVSGTYKAANLKVSGYQVVRNLDDDPAKQVLVTPAE